jgi:hypothetical protein
MEQLATLRQIQYLNRLSSKTKHIKPRDYSKMTKREAWQLISLIKKNQADDINLMKTNSYYRKESKQAQRYVEPKGETSLAQAEPSRSIATALEQV